MSDKLFKKSYQLVVLACLVMLGSACSNLGDNHSEDQQTDQSSEPVIVQKPSSFEYYQILSEDFYKLAREEGQKWQSYFDLLEYHKVLVLSELKRDEDYKIHNNYLEKYISASEHYLDFLANLKSKATKQFTAYAIPEAQVTPVLDYLLSTYEKQKVTLISLLGAHIDYGKKMQSLLFFLQANQQSWQLVNEQIDMEDKELAQQYNTFIDDIVALEDQIEAYSKELDFHLK